MKTITGFCDPAEAQPNLSQSRNMTVVEDAPVRSLVQVRFGNGRTLIYYNDRFRLNKGDYVYVSGRMAGEPARVVSVTTRFRIHTSDYEKVLYRLDFDFHGTFVPSDCEGYMQSVGDCALTTEQVRSWVIPPRVMPKRPVPVRLTDRPNPGLVFIDEEDELVTGEGYEFYLDELEACPDMEPKILARGREYHEEHQVRYLEIRGSSVTAFVQGSKWYEIDLRLENGYVSDLYCDCPYPGLCKHAAAVALLLRELLDVELRDLIMADPEAPEELEERETPVAKEETEVSEEREERLILIEHSFFMSLLEKRRGEISV